MYFKKLIFYFLTKKKHGVHHITLHIKIFIYSKKIITVNEFEKYNIILKEICRNFLPFISLKITFLEAFYT